MRENRRRDQRVSARRIMADIDVPALPERIESAAEIDHLEAVRADFSPHRSVERGEEGIGWGLSRLVRNKLVRRIEKADRLIKQQRFKAECLGELVEKVEIGAPIRPRGSRSLG